jgi:hypothetical protein
MFPALVTALAVVTMGCRSEGAAMSSNRSPLPMNDAAGLWAVEGPGVRPGCRAALTLRDRAPAKALDFERCSGGPLARATIWRIAGGGVELIDATGAVVLRLVPRGPDRFEGQGAAGRFELTRAPEA